MEKDFKSKEQELSWKAFSGQCGKEFAGNPVFMEMFINSMERNKMNDGRDYK